MDRYRKKPVVVEAVQLTDDADWEAIADWCGGCLENHELGDSGEYETMLSISTLEGIMLGLLSDWIIKGVKGEFYPCKADIFEATYEPVAGQEGTVTE